MRRLVLALAVLALAVCAPAVASAATPNYLSLATQGLKQAHKYYWNSSLKWWNDDLNPGSHIAPNGVPIPLADVWNAAPLFEAFDGVALASPTKANKRAAARFAKYADRKYWNPDLKPHGGFSPYPGDRGVDACTFFDDNSWWGLGFLDAYRVTHNGRFLKDAKRTNNFVDARGWKGGGLRKGMRWNTWKGSPDQCPRTYAMEALAAASALAAGIYEQTGSTKYRNRANKYFKWANTNAYNQSDGLYETLFRLPANEGGQAPLTYVEGSFAGALLSLCRGHKGHGDQASCAKARDLGRQTYDHFVQTSDEYFPPQAAIMFRWLVQLSAYEKDPFLWNWASTVANKAMNKAPDSKYRTLYLNCWDGTPPSVCGRNDVQYGQLKAHSATVELFAFLAAFPRP
ncbi:MAG: hypothetical protein JOZ25_10970 [Actinobacteria bacterium]|nr:hypothetical protein [Actinomycetota bacterium]